MEESKNKKNEKDKSFSRRSSGSNMEETVNRNSNTQNMG